MLICPKPKVMFTGFNTMAGNVRMSDQGTRVEFANPGELP